MSACRRRLPGCLVRIRRFAKFSEHSSHGRCGIPWRSGLSCAVRIEPGAFDHPCAARQFGERQHALLGACGTRNCQSRYHHRIARYFGEGRIGGARARRTRSQGFLRYDHREGQSPASQRAAAAHSVDGKAFCLRSAFASRASSSLSCERLKGPFLTTVTILIHEKIFLIVLAFLAGIAIVFALGGIKFFRCARPWRNTRVLRRRPRP